ncbi:MAG: ABC transporter permease, partial [Cyanobacteria bacterium P01_D01_bin.123]
MARQSTLRMVRQRLLGAIPSVIGVVVVTFLLTRALPGDPAAFFAGPAATAEAIEEVRRNLGLDKSLIEQFFIYLGELVRGDLGTSLTTGQSVVYDLTTR